MHTDFKDYGKIKMGGVRLVTIEVIKNDKESLYLGKAEDAPEDILNLHFWKAEISDDRTIYYTYDQEYLEKNKLI